MPPVVVSQSSPPYAFKSVTLNAGASVIAVLAPEDAITVAAIASAASAATVAVRTDRRSMKSPPSSKAWAGTPEPASVTPQLSARLSRLVPPPGVVSYNDGYPEMEPIRSDIPGLHPIDPGLHRF